MARIRNVGLSRGILVAACMLLSRADAFAQSSTLPAYSDPFAPSAQTDPNKKPPKFQKTTKPPKDVQVGPPPYFVSPPASGAGKTGFDSTNARKAKVKTAKTKPADTQNAVAPGVAAPAPVSPYQTFASDSATKSFAAGPPGTPPVEPLTPIQKPPKKRKAHEEPPDPYAPLGVKAGSFLLYPAIEFSAGRNSNPGQTNPAQAANLWTVAPELKVRSDWSRHELKADLRGSYSGFSPDQQPSLNRPYFNGNVDGRVDVTHDTRIDVNARALVSTDTPNSPNLQAGLAKLPVFTTFGGNAGVGQKFNRLDLSVKGDVERTVYQKSSLTDGTTASNDDRNYNQYSGIARAGYEMTPGFIPFVEASVDTRVHDLTTDFFGYQRDSNGVTGKVGTTYEFSRLLTGESSIGYTIRNYQDPRLNKLSGIVGASSLTWTPSALTSVKFTSKSTVGESDVPGVSGALYRDVGVQVDHAFRRWLIGTVKAGFGLDDYVGLNREDKRFSAAVGLTYKLNRTMQLKGEIRQDWLRSNETGNNYTATTYMLGLRLQQ